MKRRTATGIAFILLLLSFASTQLLIPAVKATGYDYDYGAASVLYGSKWQQRDQDIDQMNYAFPQIYDLFEELMTYDYHTYGHLYEMRQNWDWSTVSSQINDFENNHEWGEVFYYGHMGMEGIYLGFHEAGEQTGPEPDVIWDYEIYDYTDDVHNFVFLWVCQNGMSPGDDEPEPHGMSYCWFRRNLGYNGYSYPDGGPDCFIGFNGSSPCLSDGMGTYTYPYGENIYKFWLVFFYYFALSGYSIKGALDQASYMVEYDGYWLDSNNRLSQGWNYYWPGWVGENPPPGWPEAGNYSGQMKIYGNGNINLPEVLDWPSTPSVSGPTIGEVNTSYQFSASSTDPYSHNIRYTFNWGDGSTPTVTGWYSSGATAYASHSWSSEDQYSVKVKAECSNGGWSSWSSPHTIDIGEIHQLTMLAINQYGQPGYVPLYIDNQYVGTTGYTYGVTEGDHQIGVPGLLLNGHYSVFVCYYIEGDYVYDNIMTLSVTEDKTVYACYWTYW
jgi:hypothetical protein